MTRNHLNNRHKKTIGTDFDQFCAACELIFSRPIKCCSRIYNIEKCCLGIKKNKCCSGNYNLQKFEFNTNFSSKCCCQMISATQLAVESCFRKKQVFELFFHLQTKYGLPVTVLSKVWCAPPPQNRPFIQIL